MERFQLNVLVDISRCMWEYGAGEKRGNEVLMIQAINKARCENFLFKCYTHEIRRDFPMNIHVANVQLAISAFIENDYATGSSGIV